jgi:hypothetical protein
MSFQKPLAHINGFSENHRNSMKKSLENWNPNGFLKSVIWVLMTFRDYLMTAVAGYWLI